MQPSLPGPELWVTPGRDLGEMACHMASDRSAPILVALSCSTRGSMDAAASILILMLIILSINAYTTLSVGRRSASCSWPGSPGVLCVYWMECIRLRPRSIMSSLIEAIRSSFSLESSNLSANPATPGRLIGSSGEGGNKVFYRGAASGRGLPHEFFSIFEHFSGR
jgi:hypothetical protein